MIRTQYPRCKLEAERLEARDVPTTISLPGVNPIPTAVAFGNLTGALSPKGTPILDLIATDAATNTVVIFKGRLGGGFDAVPAATLALPAGASPSAIAVVDLNGDTRPDLVIANNGLTAASGRSVSAFLNNSLGGAISFGARSDVNGGENPVGIAIANFDGDASNHLDLAVANGTVNGANNFTVTILLGDGAGGLGSPVTVKVGDNVPSASELVAPSGLAAGELSGDTKPDLAVSGSNGLVVLNNTTATPGLPTFSVLAARLTNHASTSVAIGPVNADAANDIVATSTDSGGLVLTFRNDGSNNYTAAPFTAEAAPTAIQLADVSADGLLDIALVNNVIAGTAGTMRNGGGSAISFASETARPVGLRPNGLAIGDTNQDGVPDMVTSNGGDGTITLLESTVPPSRNLAISGTGGAAAIHLPDAGGVFTSSATVTLTPFAGYLGSVRTAAADVNGDAFPDTVLVTGPGTPLRVAVVSGADNSTVLIQPFDPFGGNFTGGGFVAAADIDGDGKAEFIVTPDQGGGPRVTIFSLVGGAAKVKGNFLGIDDSNFRGGCRAALGDVNKDDTPDLAVCAGFLGGPRTALFDGKTLFSTPTRLVGDFYAFPGSDATTLRNGVFVASGDVNGDGFSDLIFGGGPGGAPRVFVLSGALISANNVAGAQSNPIANFFVAGNVNDRGGVRLATKNADGDGKADVIAGSGEGSKANVRIYLGKNFTGTGEPGTFQDLSVFGGGVLPGGVFVG